jgi:arylsulfatase A-like enzyme
MSIALRAVVAMGAGIVLVAGPAPAGTAADRPNVVVILADDLGAEDLGPFGNAGVRTPHLDRLAARGMCFDRAFVTASSCSPSRASLLTGRYPHATGAEELHWPLPAAQATFVERLRDAGYWTAAAGKWHLGAAAKARFDLVREANPAGFTLAEGKATLDAGGTGAFAAGCDQWVPVLRERPRDRPFFLWLAALDPHRDYRADAIPRPHRPEDVTVPPELPDTPDVRRDLALYYDEIARLDGFVGAVVAELGRQGVADSTLILFLSDNGRPFPRAKTTLYDTGVRTPLIACWPGHVPAGTRSGSLVSTVDLGPTILELAGAGPLPTAQGLSAARVLTDPTARVRERAFSERNWHDYAAHGRSVRTERHRYIRNDDAALSLNPPADAVRSPTFREMRRLRDAGRLAPEQRDVFATPRPAEELYDLQADPHERTNLAAVPAHAATLVALRAALADWSRETADPPPPERLTPDEFDRETGQALPGRARRPRMPPPETASPAGPRAG